MDLDNPWIVLDKVWILTLNGQSMDCQAQNDTQRSIGAGKLPPTRDQVCPLARNECPFIIGTRCRRFEEEDTTNFIF